MKILSTKTYAGLMARLETAESNEKTLKIRLNAGIELVQIKDGRIDELKKELEHRASELSDAQHDCQNLKALADRLQGDLNNAHASQKILRDEAASLRETVRKLTVQLDEAIEQLEDAERTKAAYKVQSTNRLAAINHAKRLTASKGFTLVGLFSENPSIRAKKQPKGKGKPITTSGVIELPKTAKTKPSQTKQALPTTPEEYAKAQAKWIEDNGITVGSKVKVLRKFKNKEGGSTPLFQNHMAEYVGQAGIVVDIYSSPLSGRTRGIRVKFNDDLWGETSWPYFVLEPVK